MEEEPSVLVCETKRVRSCSVTDGGTETGDGSGCGGGSGGGGVHGGATRLIDSLVGASRN